MIWMSSALETAARWLLNSFGPAEGQEHEGSGDCGGEGKGGGNSMGDSWHGNLSQ
jgi:hypothetical protein